VKTRSAPTRNASDVQHVEQVPSPRLPTTVAAKADLVQALAETHETILMVEHSLLPQAIAGAEATAVSEFPPSLSELRNQGLFGFPQEDAKLFCDNPNLRFSVSNSQEYLFAQAVFWSAADAPPGETGGGDGSQDYDYSDLMLDLDADVRATPNVDRIYMLYRGGLQYHICLGEGSLSRGYSDSKGRGAIRYVDTSDGKRVRVDTYLIPLVEISRRAGHKIRICYLGHSFKPPLTVNSAGYEPLGLEPAGRDYYEYDIPHSIYHDYVLARGGEIDASQVPEGRKDV